MPILHVFLVKHPYFKFLPVSPGFCRLKLAGLNRFLPAGLCVRLYELTAGQRSDCESQTNWRGTDTLEKPRDKPNLKL